MFKAKRSKLQSSTSQGTVEINDEVNIRPIFAPNVSKEAFETRQHHVFIVSIHIIAF